MLSVIFIMSSKSADALDTQTGVISFIRNELIAASTALFGHPVDVSPVGHFAEFFLLGLALANALRTLMPLSRSCVLAVVLASCYGVSDELHQIFVPGRSCDPMDWLVDTVAALCAVLLFSALLHLKRKRKKTNG